VKIVKTLKDHQDLDFENLWRYDIPNESFTIKPQWFTQRLENEANVLSTGFIQSERFDELSHKREAFMLGVGI
jgi:hypothetical protein